MGERQTQISVHKLLRRGFTLIELLVVVAIMALLMGILLPSLSKARKEAMAVQCATNMHHVGQAVAMYLVQHEKYPVSYAYRDWLPITKRYIVDLSPEGQERVADHPHGYVHWSHFLYEDGKVNEQAFQCPMFDNGGVPRTNPGPDPEDWVAGQIDDHNHTSATSSAKADWQAPFMAYTANAAIMPRNKFTMDLASQALMGSDRAYRTNQLVRESQIENPGMTILAAEFVNDWEFIGVGGNQSSSNYIKSKSHRPVNPFYGLSGTEPFAERDYGDRSPARPSFFYEPLEDPFGAQDERERTYGLLPYKTFKSPSYKPFFGSKGRNLLQLNAVGRHHPGGEEWFGGTSNFLYADTHVERKTILDTIKQREWGRRYYSVTGYNKVAEVQPGGR